MPRTLSSINAELSAICSGDASSPYTERVRLIHRLPSNLAPEQLERCRAFLESTLAGQPLPDLEFNGLKNELVFALLRQREGLTELAGLLVRMSRAPETDATWRDYCVQFLGKCYPRIHDARSREAMAEMFWEALRTRRRGRAAGSAARQLMTLGHTFPEFPPERVSAASLEALHDSASTYNDRSELTGAQSSVDAAYSYSYSYDPIGNRITASEAGVPWTYTTNNLNQYTSAIENNDNLSFSYDLDGSTTYRPVDGDSGWAQLWNGENRMVETYKGTDRLTFKYDYQGRRVEKCVYSDNTLTSRTLFVYDGFKCVEELDGLNGNAVTMRHAWQPSNVGLDVILATTDADGTSFFLHDANKNIMQSIGVTSEHYIYSPFGTCLSLKFCHVGFSSEVHDTEADLNYYIFRYYSPCITTKWINRDPMEEKLVLFSRLFCYASKKG